MLDAKIRKQRDILRESGMAVVALGLWSIVKNGTYLWFHPSLMLNLLEESGVKQFMDGGISGKIILIVIVVLTTAFVMIFRWFIGFHAIREAGGKPGGKLYLLISVIYIALLIWAVIYSFIRKTPAGQEEELVASRILDLTSAVAMAGIVISAVRLRKLLGEQEDRG